MTENSSSRELKIITTADGSHTLLNEALHETYHSQHGAMQESLHVFILNGVQFVFQQLPAGQTIRIFEVGFGTGLNALLAARFSVENNVPIEYKSVEISPLSTEIWSALNYASDEREKELFCALHHAEWNKEGKILNTFTLKKINSKVQDLQLAASAHDVIFFDAFAPNKQPEMWSREVLSAMFETLCRNGILVTYCAQGQFKRDLIACGFEVESLPGPPGKKEMVRARKP